jgi:hypothetical protein
VQRGSNLYFYTRGWGLESYSHSRICQESALVGSTAAAPFFRVWLSAIALSLFARFLVPGLGAIPVHRHPSLYYLTSWYLANLSFWHILFHGVLRVREPIIQRTRGLAVANIWRYWLFWRSLVFFGESWCSNKDNQTKKPKDIFHAAARHISNWKFIAGIIMWVSVVKEICVLLFACFPFLGAKGLRFCLSGAISSPAKTERETTNTDTSDWVASLKVGST